MSQYIGKTISLVSVTDNRYVGLLEEIDSEKGTVTLQNVRCFGTEGRKNWGPEEIYPNPTIYKSVKFNGNEVKDLSILDVKLEEVQPVLPPQGVMQPASAMPGTGKRFQQQQQQQQQLQQPQQPQPQTQVPAAVAGYGVYAPEPTPGEPTATAVSTGQRAHATPQQPRAAAEGQRRQSAQNRKVEIPQEDFDFQSNNAKFVKDENETPGSEPSNNEPVASAESHPEQFYNKKSSFFDSISTSTDTGSNMRWQEEKAMNMDTFGQASARPRFGRGGRGRGRGGRGRGNRGRGNRGGFQNRNNYQHDSQNGQFSRTQQIEF